MSLDNPTVRLAARALVAGLLAFFTSLQASSQLDWSVVRGAGVGAALAALEYFTPLNKLVGKSG